MSTYGLELERLLSERLRRLNVPHERTMQWSDDDVMEQIDLRVFGHNGDPLFEIQVTTRPKCVPKMRRFVEAALLNLKNRPPRLYLHVVCSIHQNVRHVAERAAWAIKELWRRLPDFGTLRVAGACVIAGRAKRQPRIEFFEILEAVGLNWLGRLATRILADRRKQAVALARALPSGQLLWPPPRRLHEIAHSDPRHTSPFAAPQTRHPLRIPARRAA